MSSLLSHSTYIDGRWHPGEGSSELVTVSPGTEAVIGRTSASSVTQTHAAVAAARKAFDSPLWSQYGPRERSAVLHQLADLLEKNAEELARLVVDEVGSPISLARTMQVGAPVEVLRWYAEAALRGPRGSYEQALPLYDRPVLSSSLLRQIPAGVVAAIPAFNYPINLLMWKLGGAIASGCTSVVLPSPSALMCTRRVFELVGGLGLPPGVVNLVVGGVDVGRALTTDPDVDMITFTGSDTVGAQVMAQAAGSLTRTVLELGGKAADIVLPGCDPETTVAPSVLRFVRNAGQGCGAWTRILVHADEIDDFGRRATAFVETLQVGDPHDEATVVGPVISAQRRDIVERSVAAAVERGASLLTGGSRPLLPHGHFVAPTILRDVSWEDPICAEELFAPVGVLISYRDVDEAVAIANSSPFGLNANVFGEISEALGVARRLRVGTVTVNGGSGMRPDAPWGGLNRSGVGRELGEDGFAEFFEVQHLQWPLATPARPPGT